MSDETQKTDETTKKDQRWERIKQLGLIGLGGLIAAVGAELGIIEPDVSHCPEVIIEVNKPPMMPEAVTVEVPVPDETPEAVEAGPVE